MLSRVRCPDKSSSQAWWEELRGPSRSGQSEGTSPAPCCRMDGGLRPLPREDPGSRAPSRLAGCGVELDAGSEVPDSHSPRPPPAGSAGEGQGRRLPRRQPTAGPGSPSGGGRPPLGAGALVLSHCVSAALSFGVSFPELGFDQNVYKVKVSLCCRGQCPCLPAPLPAECGVSASLGKGWHLGSGGWAGPAPGLTSGDIFAQTTRKARCSPSLPASPLQPLLRSPPQPRKHSPWQ